MKTLITAAAFAAATLALPQIALAQQSAATPTIVINGKFQKDWDNGSKMEREGLADLADAQRDLSRYSRDLNDTQESTQGSSARAENAARTFRQLVAQRTDFRDADKAAKWAKRVESAASEWDKYDERSGDGADDVEKATRRRDKAKKAVEAAQAKIERGRSMMAAAERRSAGGSR